ncbi:MAG: 8-amino-7-oxononanoate synthase [Gammaproteobacteria bacterium]|nr:8-amino-7-oxononanoate synthase [Gammaproteobacteria bacterium]
MRSYSADLLQRQQQQLYRRRRVVTRISACEVEVEGQAAINFCSNDYLGLADHPQLVRALQDGAEQYGVGSGAAHLVSGHTPVHHRLEERLAELSGYPRALCFGSGYLANLALVTALARRGDRLLQDRLNHASLYDGALLSRAKLCRYDHADPAAAERLLQQGGAELLVTDGVFSMDGDIAPLPQLADLAQRYRFRLVVDDAHGFGLLGPKGAGTIAHFGLGEAEVPIWMATLGKAVGCSGAFIAANDELIETIIQNGRSYIYTTAPPPAIAAATLVALDLVQREEGRRQRLQQLIERFRRGMMQLGYPLLPSSTAIQPVVVGESGQAMAMSEALLEHGLLVSAIRPPTVPAGSARLRVTLSAAHSDEALERLLAAFDTLSRGGWQQDPIVSGETVCHPLP